MSSARIAATLASISSDEQLRYENYQVVSLVQALLGSITPNMIAISIRCSAEAIHLHFYLEYESASDREEIDDIEGELAALQFTEISISAHVAIAGQRFDANAVEGRKVYLRNESVVYHPSRQTSGAFGNAKFSQRPS